MRMWRCGVAGAGTLALVIGVVTLPARPWSYMLAPVAGCLTLAVILAVWRRSAAWLPAASALVGATSLLVTVAMLTAVDPGPFDPKVPTTLWLLLEPAVLLVFVYLPVRWSPPYAAVWGGGTAGLGEALSVQRYIQDTGLNEAVAASAMWMVFAVAMAAIAWYLRWLAAARRRAVAEARQSQRLELAADLHDFVAHDVSEIVAQAQAGNLVLAPKDERVSAVLRRIEAAGLRALASMDRTVHMLRDTDGATVTVPGVLADVDDVLARFRTAGTVRAHLERRLSAEVPREIGAVGYRVVVEALTNVRRHAADATTVTVRLDEVDECLRVRVTDDGHGGARPRAHRPASGAGLTGLSQRVAALGGELTAEPVRPHGWRLTARLPLTPGSPT